MDMDKKFVEEDKRAVNVLLLKTEVAKSKAEKAESTARGAAATPRKPHAGEGLVPTLTGKC